MAEKDKRKWLWAYYGDDRDCLIARIRRYIEENNVPGWEVVWTERMANTIHSRL